MTGILETKACNACATAKRRCGKQTPRCLRCRSRSIECSYPPTKPACFVLCREDSAPPVEADSSSYSTSQLSAYSPGFWTRGAGDARLYLADNSGLFTSPIDDQLASSWFASLETWKIRYPPADQTPLSVTDLKRSVSKIRGWLTEWIEKGSNTFIHAQLYRNRLPPCVQDAYAALSCYLHKTASNEQTVFQIIEDRASKLVAKYSSPSAGLSQENNSTSSVPLDSLEHIARVHALLVYQLLGLFDGDIRLRYLSETYIPVLYSWMREMVEQASQTACLGGSVISSSYEETVTDLTPSHIAQSDSLLWYSWILAESVRRTWVVGSAIQVIFSALQEKSVRPCQGGVMFTTRQGIWEAQSAIAWEKICSEVHAGLMQMAETDRLFTEVAPEEVNEFTKVVLEITFGRERMERWGVQIE